MTAAETLGFSPERLARIDRHLQEKYIGPGRLAGARFVLTRRGEVVHSATLGLADAERGLPMADDTVFRIYSMTKPLTSVALMMLVEEGRIALDDPVKRYIPQWAGLRVFVSGAGPFVTRPTDRPMRVVDLMRHTSGLTYGLQQHSPVDAAYRALGMEERDLGVDLPGMIAALAELPLEFSPGEGWSYSVSTDVVGHLIEVVTGQPLDQALRARIIDPLRMVDTGFVVRPDQKARFAACYEPAPQGGLKLQDDPATSPFLRPPVLVSGGGGLVSTTADYLRFTQMLLRGGELDGARILAPKTVELMASNHLPGGADLTQMSRSLFSEDANAGVGFGLGFAVVVDPVRNQMTGSVGEFYWGGMASTGFWVDPAEEITAVFMTQLIPSSTYPIRRELRTLTYAALMEPRGCAPRRR